MVLTTHSMEEADVLCNRIGIVNQGVMKCLGSQNRLKNLYGGGYHLFINCQLDSDKPLQPQTSEEKRAHRKQVFQSLEQFISRILPQAIKLREFNGQFVYKIPLQGFDAEKLFNEIEESKGKKEIMVSDWGIS